MIRQHKQSGFTIVELIVAVAIMAVLAAMAVPAYRAWIQNTQIRTVAESIQNGISKARAEALMRNTPVRFTLNADTSWVVQCVTAANCADLAGGIVETRSGSDGSSASISVNPNAGQVTFTNLGVKSSAAGQLTQVTVDSTTLASAESRELNVVIGVGGSTRVCDPNTGATDPRRC